MKNLLLLLCLWLPSANLLALQDHAQLRASVISFVQQQTANLPGKASFQVDEIDTRLSLADCLQTEVFLPSGSRLLGKTAVGIRCNENNGWRILVPVQIKLSMDLVVSSHPLLMGNTLRATDLATQNIEVDHSGGLTDLNQAVGKVLRYSLAAGQVLRADMLRDPYSITQGQVVKLTLHSNGLHISGDGVALNNASAGQAVQIRTPSGRVISGIADNSGGVNLTP